MHDRFTTIESFGCAGGRDGWTNRLIRCDNGEFLAAVRGGYLGEQIAAAGGIKLVYLDPPFDAGRDFGVSIDLGGGATAREFGFRDRGFGGTERYVALLRERFAAIREVLAADGALYVHCDWRLDYLLRVALDEVFGRDCFRNAVTWKRDAPGKGAKRNSGQWPRNADTILYYTKSATEWYFAQPYVPLSPAQQKPYRYTDEHGRKYKAVQLGDYSQASIARLERERRIHHSASGARYKKYYLDEAKATVDAIWADLPGFGTRTAARELTGYATQKPEALLERIVCASTRPGDLVADLTCGSGTTPAVCERLGRKWLGVDLGQRAIGIARTRLARLGDGGQPRFDVVVGPRPAVPGAGDLVRRVLMLYGAEPRLDHALVNGARAGRAVAVVADAAVVGRELLEAVVAAARASSHAQVDLLGFDFERGLLPDAVARAARRGVDLCCRYIPSDVLDGKPRRAVTERFRPACAFSVALHRAGQREVRVELTAGEPSPAGDASAPSAVDNWAVDFRYGECPHHAGADPFHPNWMSTRTRSSRLEFTSAPFVYAEPGPHRVAVRVVDVFGNDGLVVRDVTV